MIDAWLSQIAEIISDNMWLAPLLALLAGILTSVTPCSLSSVPLIVGYVGGVGEKNTKKAFAYSAVFSIGMAVTFVALGIIATSAGRLMGTSSPIWYILLGVLMVLMALQTWEIFNFIPSTNLLSKSRKRGFRCIYCRSFGWCVFLALQSMYMNRNPKEKPCRLYLRVSPQEKKKITELAESCGIPVAEYLRKRALGWS